jgi:flagellar motor switch protein FliM
MSDPVITDEEKDALLDGVEAGEIAVQADGEQSYASVRDFEFPERSRIVSNSFPRLAVLNDQLAIKGSRSFEKLFNSPVLLRNTGIDFMSFSAFRYRSRSAILEFTLAPLEGPAIIVLAAPTLARLVETFFGGSSDNPLRIADEGFTPGELTVAMLFGREFVKTLEVAWQSFYEVKAEIAGVRQESDVVEILEPGEHVVVCNFDVECLGDPEQFQVVLPTGMLAPILPALEGQKRDRNPEEDVRWERSLRDTVTDSVVHVTTTVGEARLTLRDIVDLKPGDVIGIDDPRNGRLLAAGKPVIAGRFGVHDGCYAMETTHWLTVAAAASETP